MHLKHMFYKANSLKFIDVFVDELPSSDRILANRIKSIQPTTRFKRLHGKIKAKLDTRSEIAKTRRKNKTRKKR